MVGGTSRRTTAVSVKVSEEDLRKMEYLKRVLPDVFAMRSDFIKKVVPLILYTLQRNGRLSGAQIPENIVNQGREVAEEIAGALGIGVDELIGLLASKFSGAA